MSSRGCVSSPGYLLPQLDGPSDAAIAATAGPQRKKTANDRSGMTWPQRPGKEDREKEKDARPKLLIDTHNCNNNAAATTTTIASPSSSSSSQPPDGAYACEPQHPRNRSFTGSRATRTSTESAAARFNSDMRRAISSGGRLKKKKAHVSPAAQALGKMDSVDRGLLLPSPRAAAEHGDAATAGKGKRKWRKRVFSSDFFKPSGGGGTENKVNHKPEKNNGQLAIAAAAAVAAAAAATPKTATLGTTPPPPPDPSLALTSGHAVTTKESRGSRCASSGTDANQAASTVESCQTNGIGSSEERESAGKVFNDSVIGTADGKVGCTSKVTCAHRWRPPILSLDMQVLAAVDRVPVTTGRGYDLWIAVVLQGRVVGDIDFPGTSGPNTAGIGLDVGLLLDVSYEFFSFFPFPVQS